ncbi:hypothetical protein [Streptomyces beihaiensis]|uniref:Uncharacterized protein n=1 Tax=Streptomyces beihaiensis TaxID=2984495 RepID=A0ABT3U4I6_9ACTN|nr:hypothetical protein [Streptomyces beihaiensis]MCX3063556.1 hypothetical protein [Streptomyces beihaiensis]
MSDSAMRDPLPRSRVLFAPHAERFHEISAVALLAVLVATSGLTRGRGASGSVRPARVLSPG